MFRTVAIAVAIAIATPSVAAAQSARDAQGATVDVHEAGTVMLFWSMEDRDAAEKLTQLADLADAGMDVIAVNTDDATAKARVRPFVKRLGVNVRTAQDTDGSLRQEWRTEAGEAVVLRPVQVHQVVWRGTDLASLMPVAGPSEAAVTAR